MPFFIETYENPEHDAHLGDLLPLTPPWSYDATRTTSPVPDVEIHLAEDHSETRQAEPQKTASRKGNT